MFKEIQTTELVQITSDIKAYAEGLSAGTHYAWTATSEGDIGQPVVGTGFMYEIKKYSSAPIQITAIAFSGNNNLYLLRKHGSSWRPWVVFEGSHLGGGNTCSVKASSFKGGGVVCSRNIKVCDQFPLKGACLNLRKAALTEYHMQRSYPQITQRRHKRPLQAEGICISYTSMEMSYRSMRTNISSQRALLCENITMDHGVIGYSCDITTRKGVVA